MRTKSSVFVCQNCGFESPKWVGQCPDCGAWNTMEETVKAPTTTAASRLSGAKRASSVRTETIKLSNVKSYDHALKRLPTGMGEFDRVLGGGIVQQDEIVRDGNKVVVNRSEALATELAYLAQIIPDKKLKAVYATGHDCQCGACKFFNNDVSVHEVLHAEKGSQAETDEMADRVARGVAGLVPRNWVRQGIVQQYVVHIDPKTNVYEKMVKIG